MTPMPALTVANALTWAVQVALLIALGAALFHVVRLTAPRARLAFYYGLLVTSVLLPLLQPAHIPLGSAESPAIGALPGTSDLQASGELPLDEPGRGAASGGGSLDVPPPRTLPPVGLLLLVAWTAGCALRLGWLALGARGLVSLRRTAAPLPPGTVAADEVRALVPVSADIRLTPDVAAPVTFGARQPVVLLPHDFAAASLDEQKAILCHELLHVKRGDWRMTAAEEVARSFAWFHPAIWWLVDQIHLSREQVVDEEVIRILGCRDGYLDALLRLAAPRPQPLLRPASLFLRKSHLAQRIALLLREAPMSKRRLAFASIAVAASLVAGGTILVRALPLAAEPPRLPAVQSPVYEDGPGTQGPPRAIVTQAGMPIRQAAPMPAGHTPAMTTAVMPTYPAEARARGAGGKIAVWVRIREDGTVEAARLATYHPGGGVPDPELAAAAVEAARTSRFDRLRPGDAGPEWPIVYTFDPSSRGVSYQMAPPAPPPPPPAPPRGAGPVTPAPPAARVTLARPDAELEAKLLFEKEAHPTESSRYTELAGYYSRIGDFERAIAALREWAQIDSANPIVHYTVATYFWDKAFRDSTLTPEKKRAIIADGLESVNRALELKPDYMEAIIYKNLLFRLLANLETDPVTRSQLLQQADQLRDEAVHLRDARQAASGITYDDFIQLGEDERRRTFQEASPEAKARLKRTHAERWLEANRARLSPAQLAVMQEAIVFITPEIYRNPDRPGLAEQERAIKEKLACVLGRDNARRAFMVEQPDGPVPPATWRSTIDAWLSWFTDCVVR